MARPRARHPQPKKGLLRRREIGSRVNGVIVRQEWIGRNLETRFRPCSQARRSRPGTLTRQRFSSSRLHWRLAGITFRPKFQDDAIAEICGGSGKWVCRAMRSLALARKQSAQARNSGVAAVGRDQNVRARKVSSPAEILQ